ncbi:MAG: 50S ribosomal protein L13 [Pseudomonadota bacterium]
MIQTTYSAKPSDIKRNWYVIDAEDLVLGRLSAKVSMLLRGKHKPYYSTNLDCGDYVIIINADKVALTGKKKQNKVYYRHTGYPGGLKQTTPGKILTGKVPTNVVRKAIERMISRNPLGRQQMTKLKIYSGAEHPHKAQNPIAIDFAADNKKNKVTAQ